MKTNLLQGTMQIKTTASDKYQLVENFARNESCFKYFISKGLYKTKPYALVFILIANLLFASNIFGQITQPVAWAKAYDQSTSSGNTYSFSIPSGSNRILIVGVNTIASSANNGQEPTISYGGTLLSRATSDYNTTARPHTYLYYLNDDLVMDGSSKLLSVSVLNTNLVNMTVWYAVYSGVDLTVSPYTTSNNVNATGGTGAIQLSSAMTIAANEQAVYISTVYNSSNATIPSYSLNTNWTSKFATTGTGTNIAWKNEVVSRSIPSTGTTDNAITGTLNTSCRWAISAMSLPMAPPPPNITSLGSTSGCVGTLITINGSNLTGATASNVKIGGTPVTSITSNTGTVLVAVIGSGTTGQVTVATAGGTATSSQTFTVYQKPAQPSVITGNTTPCPGLSEIYSVTYVLGLTYAWTFPTGWNITSGGTTNSVTVTVGSTSGTISVIPTNSDECSGTPSTLSVIAGVPAAAATPSPANAASGVCFSGGGAINSVSWAAVPQATSYDVYFGAGSLPGTVTANVATNSYTTGQLIASTTYYWKVVSRNACGPATGSTWTFTTAASACAYTYSNPFWYKADGAVAFNGTLWNDETTNNNDATKSGSGTISLVPNYINFNPSLSLPAINRQFLTPTTSVSVQSFIVVNNPDLNSITDLGGLIGSYTSDLGIRIKKNTPPEWNGGNTNDWASGGSGRINGVAGFTFSGWNIVNQKAASANSYRYSIGGYYSTTIRAFFGYIAEIIAFAGAVPEQDRIESYLGIKYGITLGHDYLAGPVVGATVYAISGYGNNVAGLGNDATYGLNQKVSSSTTASGSSKIVMATTNNFTLANSDVSRTSLANGQYLIWGHDNGATNAWTTSGVYSVVARKWKAQNTGSVGAVYFQIDLTGYPAPVSGSFTLLVDNDGDFSNGGTSEFLLTNSSGTLYTASVTFPSGTSYFTISGCKKAAAAGAILGQSLVCNAPVTQTYSVPTINAATSYAWTYTGSNATITGTGNSITLNFAANATSGILRVYGVNSCGNGTVSADFPITVSSTVLVSVSQRDVSCYAGADGSITISATGGTGSYFYSVDNGVNYTSSAAASPYTQNGLVANVPYRIKVKDSNGCVSR